MNIDSISYVSPREQIRVKDAVDLFEFMIVLSAFYFPEVAEGLQEETPLIEYPRPGGKRSPLYNESEYKKEGRNLPSFLYSLVLLSVHF